MKLIRKLGTTKNKSGNIESWGVFECPIDNEEVEMRLSNGLKAKSCGCIRSSYKHGESYTRLYNIWKHIKSRCLNQNNKAYKDYGGRGITICNEWLEFIPFRDWALSNKYTDNLTIDRKDNYLGYNPNNCQWATRTEQNRNKTNTVTLQIANEIRELDKTDNYTQQELAIKFNVSYQTIYRILKKVTW